MIQDDFERICSDILTAIIESVIEQGDRDKYYHCEKALSQCMNFDELLYFNSIQKQKLFNSAIRAAVKQIPDKQTVSIIDNRNTNYSYKLTTEEFAEENSSSLENQNYITYEVKKGDTLKKISIEFFGDIEQWPNIARERRVKLDISCRVKVPVRQGLTSHLYGVLRRSW